MAISTTKGIITSDRFKTYKIGTLEKRSKVAMITNNKANDGQLLGRVSATTSIKSKVVMNLVRGSSL